MLWSADQVTEYRTNTGTGYVFLQVGIQGQVMYFFKLSARIHNLSLYSFALDFHVSDLV